MTGARVIRPRAGDRRRSARPRLGRRACDGAARPRGTGVRGEPVTVGRQAGRFRPREAGGKRTTNPAGTRPRCGPWALCTTGTRAAARRETPPSWPRAHRPGTWRHLRPDRAARPRGTGVQGGPVAAGRQAGRFRPREAGGRRTTEPAGTRPRYGPARRRWALRTTGTRAAARRETPPSWPQAHRPGTWRALRSARRAPRTSWAAGRRPEPAPRVRLRHRRRPGRRHRARPGRPGAWAAAVTAFVLGTAPYAAARPDPGPRGPPGRAAHRVAGRVATAPLRQARTRRPGSRRTRRRSGPGRHPRRTAASTATSAGRGVRCR